MADYIVIGRSSIFQNSELKVQFISGREALASIKAGGDPQNVISAVSDCNNVVIASGVLQQKSILEKSWNEKVESIEANLLFPVTLAELLLSKFQNLNLLLVGSESGLKGSYDGEYALAKASLRLFVKERQTMPNQRLNMVSPSLIYDSGMTERRSDYQKLSKECMPKGMFLYRGQVRETIESLLFGDIYINNQELELNGGKFARWG